MLGIFCAKKLNIDPIFLIDNTSILSNLSNLKLNTFDKINVFQWEWLCISNSLKSINWSFCKVKSHGNCIIHNFVDKIAKSVSNLPAFNHTFLYEVDIPSIIFSNIKLLNDIPFCGKLMKSDIKSVYQNKYSNMDFLWNDKLLPFSLWSWINGLTCLPRFSHPYTIKTNLCVCKRVHNFSVHGCVAFCNLKDFVECRKLIASAWVPYFSLEFLELNFGVWFNQWIKGLVPISMSMFRFDCHNINKWTEIIDKVIGICQKQSPLQIYPKRRLPLRNCRQIHCIKRKRNIYPFNWKPKKRRL